MGRCWLRGAVVLALAVAGPACADIYTWVDKNGTTNVSNVPPPDDVRVTKVARAAPKDPAREAAAREAARLAEMRALHDRVDELSKEVEQSRAIPPPYVPAPVAFGPAAAPTPTVVVTVINQPAQPEAAPSGCDYALGGCGLYFPGYTYYAPPYQRGFHKPHHHRRGAGTQTRGQSSLIPPLIPYPVTTRPPVGRRMG